MAWRLRGREANADPNREPATRDKRHQLLRFLIVGTLGFVVDAGTLTIGLLIGLPAAAARVPSFIAAAIVTWLINRSFTFQATRSPTLSEFLLYMGAMSLGFAINYGVFLACLWASSMFAAMPVLALIPATLAGLVANFLTSRRILSR